MKSRGTVLIVDDETYDREAHLVEVNQTLRSPFVIAF